MPARKQRKTMARYGGSSTPRGITRQAHSDVERGLEDTECRGAKKPAGSPCTPRRSSGRK